MRKLPRTLVAALAFCAASCCGQARAALDSDAASVVEDAARLHGDVVAHAFGEYELRELALPSGGMVHEFLDPSGHVFAVTWRTPVPPDLEHLLGARYADYVAAVRALEHPGLHRSLHLTAAGLVVEASGRPRAYEGRAYLAAALPPGLPVAAVR